jgi:NMD protein affecting ribosome stability and mRNA decay
MRFCPKCGKKGIKGDFCSECSEDELGLEFKDIIIKKCLMCDSFMVQNRWIEFCSLEEGMAAAVMSKIRNPKKLELEINPVFEELKDKPGASQDITLQISAAGAEFEVPARIDFTYCDHCSKVGTGYLEGTLQLRNATHELYDFVKRDITANKGKGVHITKETGKLPNVDIQLTSKKYLRALGKKLKQRFNGELNEAAQLFSYNPQTSKDIHRVNLLFTLHGRKVGDIVEQRGKRIKITTLGKKVSGVDIETGKKIFLD